MNQFFKENLIDIFKNNQELKSRTAVSSSILLATIAIGLILSKFFIKALQLKVPFMINFVHIAPAEMFFATFKLAFFFGIYLASPIIFYNAIKLKLNIVDKTRNQFLMIAAALGFILFTLGILFGYYLVLPFSMYFLLGFSSGIAGINISIYSYISYCLGLFLITGMLFQIPVILYLINKVKLISLQDFTCSWKSLTICSLIVSLLIFAPPELVSIILLAVSIMCIYGLTFIFAKIF